MNCDRTTEPNDAGLRFRCQREALPDKPYCAHHDPALPPLFVQRCRARISPDDCYEARVVVWDRSVFPSHLVAVFFRTGPTPELAEGAALGSARATVAQLLADIDAAPLEDE